MEPFENISAVVAPLDRFNIDTDAIIPKQFLKSIRRTGFGPFLFDDWRYQDHGEPDQDCSNRPLIPDFILNQDPYRKAGILLTRSNFGCGSSREHAAWALAGFGFRVIIAKSFAELFYSNCFKNGLLPIRLEAEVIDLLFQKTVSNPGYELTVNLEAQTITSTNGVFIKFEIDQYRKYCLLNGLDEIVLTLQHSDEIKVFEIKHKLATPWLFEGITIKEAQHINKGSKQ